MRNLLALCAMASLVAAPASASVREAAFALSTDRPVAQTSMFVGATYRIGLDRRTDDQPSRAALRLSGMSHAPGSSELRLGKGLELSAGKTGKPAWYLAGQDVGEFKSKAQMNGTTTAVIVGGVILLGVIAAVVISDYQRSQRCIGEEGDCD
jgi:hypothetical protein